MHLMTIFSLFVYLRAFAFCNSFFYDGLNHMMFCFIQGLLRVLNYPVSISASEVQQFLTVIFNNKYQVL